jgi:MinD-like ATPase involved in chromosome partitioning or flagellar assembly
MSTDRSNPASSTDDAGRPSQTPVAVPRRGSHGATQPGEQHGWDTEQGWSSGEQPVEGESTWSSGEQPAQGEWRADEQQWPAEQPTWSTGPQGDPGDAPWQSPPEQPSWQSRGEATWQTEQPAWQEQGGWQYEQPNSGAQPAVRPAPGQQPVVRPASGPPGLNDESLLTHRRQASSRGWRRAVSTITLGAVKPGLSAAEVAEAEQMRAIRTPIRGCHRIGVVSLKGGIGKTTTAAGLGLALATTRGDGVIAVDANPDAGTLSDRLVGAPPDAYSGAEWVGAHVRATDDTWIAPRSVRDLLAAVSADEIGSATDVMRYVSIAGRLHVLASEQDPETSEAFNAQEYRTTAEVISAFYSVMITDTGTGLLHSAMAGMLSMANSLVIIAAPSVDGASRAAKTLDWLDAHHYGHLVARAVVAVSHTRPRAQNVDMRVLDAHFSARCRALVHIPYDPHLVAGSVIRWNEMAAPTRSAFLRLAAAVSEDFREGWN